MNPDSFGPVLMEDAPCPNGCKKDDEFVLCARDLLSGLPGKFTVVRCKQCSLMRTDPRPTPETIGYYYPDDYGPYAGTVVSGNELNAKNWKQRIKRLLSSHSTDLPKMDPGNLLEVGCASGSFLHTMRLSGWQVEGIEFSDAAAENARRHGFTVHTGSLETAPEPGDKYDLVVAWMVVEHLHDPMLSLKKLSAWTKENGYLAFSIPNSNSFFFGKYSYNLQLPTHLYHFTPDTITALLNKAGWKVERIQHQVTLCSLFGSIGYYLRETRGDSKLSKWLINYTTRGGITQYILYPIAFLLALAGQTGRITIWARNHSD